MALLIMLRKQKTVKTLKISFTISLINTLPANDYAEMFVMI
jgi:hypothetical protein